MIIAAVVASVLLTRLGPCDTLPAGVKTELARLWPTARLPDPKQADSTWRLNARQDLATDGQPYCITGDFAGNGRRDYVLILEDSALLRLVAVHRMASGYRGHQMDTLETRALPAFSIFRAGSGLHQDMYGDKAPLRSRHDAIEVVYDESSSWTMVWDGSRYRTFWTSD